MKITKKKGDAAITFNEVEIREPLVEDLIAAEAVAGADQGVRYALALISQIAVFDGKKIPPEDIKKLRVRDFFGLAKAVEAFGLEELAKELLSSQGKAASQ